MACFYMISSNFSKLLSNGNLFVWTLLQQHVRSPVMFQVKLHVLIIIFSNLVLFHTSALLLLLVAISKYISYLWQSEMKAVLLCAYICIAQDTGWTRNGVHRQRSNLQYHLSMMFRISIMPVWLRTVNNMLIY